MVCHEVSKVMCYISDCCFCKQNASLDGPAVLPNQASLLFLCSFQSDGVDQELSIFTLLNLGCLQLSFCMNQQNCLYYSVPGVLHYRMVWRQRGNKPEEKKNLTTLLLAYLGCSPSPFFLKLICDQQNFLTLVPKYMTLYHLFCALHYKYKMH